MFGTSKCNEIKYKCFDCFDSWEESLLFSYNKYVWELAPSLVESCSCTNLWRNFKNSGHEGATETITFTTVDGGGQAKERERL